MLIIDGGGESVGVVEGGVRGVGAKGSCRREERFEGRGEGRDVGWGRIELGYTRSSFDLWPRRL